MKVWKSGGREGWIRALGEIGGERGEGLGEGGKEEGMDDN